MPCCAGLVMQACGRRLNICLSFWTPLLAKEEPLQIEGVVTEILPNAMFRVQLDGNEHNILAHTSGKMRKSRIRVLIGDRVTVEMTPYDLTKGRLVYRQK